MKLSIVIPVFNEKNTLEDILKAVDEAPLPGEIKSKEIVLVNDCSTDGTDEILERLDERKYKVYHHKKNKGKGAALKTGFANCTGDIILIQDADLEYDPNEYVDLLTPIVEDKADVVYGSRFLAGRPHRVLYYWHSVANGVLTLLSNMFSDLNLTDMETCYKVFRKKVIDRFEIEEHRFGFEPEITAKVAALSRREGIRVYELGISYYGRTYEEGKKIGLKDAFRALWCVFKYNDSKLAIFSKYLVAGTTIALSQLLVLFMLVGVFGLNTPELYNWANGISIFASLIMAFFVHSSFTWMHRFENVGVIIRDLILFLLLSSFTAAFRIYLFDFFQDQGMHYLPNALLGIVIIVILNFMGYDRIVFRKFSKG